MLWNFTSTLLIIWPGKGCSGYCVAGEVEEFERVLKGDDEVVVA